jgi:hypothetical protein
MPRFYTWKGFVLMVGIFAYLMLTLLHRKGERAAAECLKMHALCDEAAHKDSYVCKIHLQRHILDLP